MECRLALTSTATCPPLANGVAQESTFIPPPVTLAATHVIYSFLSGPERFAIKLFSPELNRMEPLSLV